MNKCSHSRTVSRTTVRLMPIIAPPRGAIHCSCVTRVAVRNSQQPASQLAEDTGGVAADCAASGEATKQRARRSRRIVESELGVSDDYTPRMETASPTPLGKMRRRGASSVVDYAEILPADDLRDRIRCYWFLTADAGEMAAGPDPALPDGSPELIFSLADPFIARPPHGPERTQPDVFVVGQITAPFAVRPSGRAALVGVRLEAHAALWLAEDFNAMRDREVDLGAHKRGVFTAIRSDLIACRTDAQPAEYLNDALRPLLAAGPHADWRVAAAVKEIRDGRGRADVADLAERLQTTPRTLQRLFSRDVGITPKYFARVVRFQQVFAAWREDPATLSRVAQECGYFDHAHLVRDFNELAGVPPATLRANMPTFTQFFTS